VLGKIIAIHQGSIREETRKGESFQVVVRGCLFLYHLHKGGGVNGEEFFTSEEVTRRRALPRQWKSTELKKCGGGEKEEMPSTTGYYDQGRGEERK